MDRRRFLMRSALASAIAAAGGAGRTMAQTDDTPKKAIPDRGPRHDADRVKTFVIAGHGDPAKVAEMLKQEPRLINATWDWGGGDFETALGGAAHMGRADIARLLLAHGARLDLFAAAMLGELEIVTAALTAFPDAIKVPGPHGIPLLAHAKAGGKEAEAVLRYLESS
jgi:hypothetical protein